VIDPSARVHPSADVEADVDIGPDTSVWHRAHLRSGSHIGAECILGKDVFIDAGVQVGDRVKIQNGALVYHGVTVEDGVFVGPGAILTNDRFPRAITSTGQLARAGDWTLAPIVLRHGCSIGAGAIIVAGTEIGRFATVGAGAVVTRDVVDHALVVGNPARRIGWVCDCGQRLTDGASGEPVPASPDRDAVMACEQCDRRFGYVPDPEGLVEQPAPTTVKIRS
jgi:acetyltransferase-like isoleucine patch superfamily enzyme